MNTVRVKTNLRCEGCVSAIREAFDQAPEVVNWKADVASPDKILTVEGDAVTVEQVDGLLRGKGYKVLGELPAVTLQSTVPAPIDDAMPASYYPIVLILFYLLGAVGLAEFAAGSFDAIRAMRHFMAGFFLVFSFFKLLDVEAFAMAFSSYDIVARRWLAYGRAYPFIELGLGAAYLANVQPWLTNLATLVVMSIGTVGVVQSLLARRKIRCACLGAVFNLPMSAVTFVEDVLMVAMAAWMLAMLAGG